MPSNEVRQSSLARGRGFTQLVKPPPPAAGGPLVLTVDGFAWDRLLSATFTYTCAATSGPRYPVITWADGDGVPFAQIPAGPPVGPSEVATVFAGQNFTAAQQPGPSVDVDGQVTSPGAGAAIVTSPAVVKGRYQIGVTTELGGTVGAGDTNNMALIANATQVAVLAVSPTVGQETLNGPYEVFMPANTTFVVQAIVAGTAGAIYNADMNIEALSIETFYAEIPDIMLKSGWQLQVGASNMKGGDTITGIALLLERLNEPQVSGTWAAEEEFGLFRAWRDAGSPAG